MNTPLYSKLCVKDILQDGWFFLTLSSVLFDTSAFESPNLAHSVKICVPECTGV